MKRMTLSMGLVVAVALLGATSVLAHKNESSSAISFDPGTAVTEGTDVTITGTVTFTGDQANGSSGGHTLFPSAGDPVVGDNAMIQRALDALGNHVACADAVDFGDNFVGPTPTDSNGQISGVFDTTDKGGQTLGFRTHHPDGGGAHGASTSSSDCVDLVIVVASEGCSQGFWTNHSANAPGGQADEWPEDFETTDQLNVHFDFTGLSGTLQTFQTNPLLTALNYGGGPGLSGGFQILMKQAVAALLNAAHEDVDFPMTVEEVQEAVNDALASEDRDEMIALGGELEALNTLGCPLGEDEVE